MEEQKQIEPLPPWVYERYFNKEDPAPMDPERQEFYQALCAKEAERLRDFFKEPLPENVRANIEEWELIFSTAARAETLSRGVGRSLAPLMGRTLASYGNGK